MFCGFDFEIRFLTVLTILFKIYFNGLELKHRIIGEHLLIITF